MAPPRVNHFALVFFFASLALSSSLPLSMGARPSSPAPSYAMDEADMTPLQKHVSFFDRNKDGIIYPSETFQGFRAIGAGLALSTVSAAFINGFLSAKTLPPGEKFSPLLPIYVKYIQNGKHGSDSGAYDAEGRFIPEKFEEIFQKHANTYPTALTEAELSEMLKANQQPNDSQGSFASSTEWKVLYMLCKDENGLLQKDTVRAVYDGSLFVKMEQERQSKMKKA